MKRNSQHTNISLLSSLECFYVAALMMALYGVEAEAQIREELRLAPQLVVNITVDQLRTDYLEHFLPLYRQDGLLRMLKEGRVYDAVSYPFSPVDRASAIACVATGTTPQYNKILGQHWMSRKTLRPEYCVSDKDHTASPTNIACTTVSDELKIATDGKALVYSLAQTEDAAILSAGHAADGAYWYDTEKKQWVTSTYYPRTAGEWIRSYNALPRKKKDTTENESVADAALNCMTEYALGKDEITDYLAITLSARATDTKAQRGDMEAIYTQLDRTVGSIIRTVESKIGKDKVMFVLTATGDTDNPEVDFEKYHIPTGTFYMNRTASLLNMYLAAVYGSGKYVETFFKNQIYLNHQLIEDKKLSYTEVKQRSKDLLMMMQGVASVSDSPYDTAISGDLWIEVNPGWKIWNEDTYESYNTRTAFVPFPLIFLGDNIKAETVETPITTERIAPTIAKCIHIRAPNACKAAPLF